MTGKALDPVSAEPADHAVDEQLLKAAHLATDGPALLDFFRRRTAGFDSRQEIPRLIEQLDHNQFRIRQKAADRLVEIGPAALPILRRSLQGRNLEVTQRLERCIRDIEQPARLGLPAAAARLLKVRQPEGAVEVLLAHLPLLDNDEETEESILETLLVLGVREGAMVPALPAALAEKATSRRAAAALVVGRSGTPAQRARVRRLLADADAKVRLRAAQGLLSARDGAAFPTLLALLTEAKPLAEAAEDLLGRAAGDGAPKIGLGDTEAGQRKCRAAWEAWWKDNGDHPGLGFADLEPSLTTTMTRRAQRATEDFLTAYRNRDRARMTRVTDVPFLLAGELLDRKKLDAQLATRYDKTKYVVRRVFTADEFVRRTDEKTQQFMARFPRASLRGVWVAPKDGPFYIGGVLIIRVRGGQAKTIGISGPPLAPDHEKP